MLAKIFVLDVNVLIHNPDSFSNFKENDMYAPMIMLDELNNHKKKCFRNGMKFPPVDPDFGYHYLTNTTNGKK
ncbi:PIN domain-containing protein [Candidatus Pandoraea novymonadis]